MITQADAILDDPQAAPSPGTKATDDSLPAPESGRLYTAEDLLKLSRDHAHRYELIHGELKKMTPAGSKHGVLAARILSRLQDFVDEHELGVVFAAETGFRLSRDPDTVRAPDAGFVGKDDIPSTGVPNTFFPSAPNLAVEIVSPYDTVSGVQDKVQSWLTHGTRLVWVVEPTTQTVTVYRPDGSAQVLQRDDALDGEDVLPGFGFELTRLFREPATTATSETTSTGTPSTAESTE